MFLTFMLIIAIQNGLANQRKLLLVQQIAKHGSIYPQYNLEGDYFAERFHNSAQNGQLTIYGKNMHYQLGKIIYKLYWQQLFGQTQFQKKYHQSKFFVKSTNYNRSIESAQSQLLGLFENLDHLELNKRQIKYSLPPWIDDQIYDNIIFKQQQENITVFGNRGSIYHPTAVHIDSSTPTMNYNRGCYLLAALQDYCPNQNQNIRQNLNSRIANQVKSDSGMVSAHQALQEYFNTSINFWEIYLYYENYKALKTINQPYPIIFDHPMYHQAYKFLGKFTIFLKYLATSHQKKIAGSLIFQEIIAVMDHAIQSIKLGDTYNIQFQLFVGHDITIATILSVLNMTSPRCLWEGYQSIYCGVFCTDRQIDFASNTILELWKQENDTYSVNFRFNGKIKLIPFCQESTNQRCDYSVFKEYIQKNIIVDDQQLQNICYTTQDTQYYRVQIALILLCICTLIVAIHNFPKTCIKSNKLKPKSKMQQKPSQKIQETLDINMAKTISNE